MLIEQFQQYVSTVLYCTVHAAELGVRLAHGCVCVPSGQGGVTYDTASGWTGASGCPSKQDSSSFVGLRCACRGSLPTFVRQMSFTLKRTKAGRPEKPAGRKRDIGQIFHAKTCWIPFQPGVLAPGHRAGILRWPGLHLLTSLVEERQRGCVHVRKARWPH